MFLSKLTVMAKKISKLLNTSVPVFTRQIIYSFYDENKDNKCKLTQFSRRKGSSAIYRSFFKTKKAPVDTLISIIRYLKVSIGTSFITYPKLLPFLKTSFYRMLKEKSFVEINIVPDQTRALTTATDVSELSKRVKKQRYDGIEEQKLYTGETSQKRKKHHKEKTPELPPPQKCRLSCPLPPPEFTTFEIPEYRSRYQSPNTRSPSVPEVSVSDLDVAKGIETSKTYVVPPNSQPLDSLTQNVPKMKALLFEPNTLKLNYDAVDAPVKIFKDEVLVQVAYSGVCGTDFFITEGRLSCGDSPIILGHEISGRVYAVGKDVDHVEPGDKIAVNAYTACSVCRFCSRGIFSGCLNEGFHNSIGISKNGGWAEFVVVKKSQVHKIPDEMELDQAALIQPLSCVLSAMTKLKIHHDMDILVQGLGLSGCLWASVLHSQGYKNVLVSEKVEKRRPQFESLGTNYTLIPPEDIGTNAVDLVIECTGSARSIERSLNVLNPNGQMCFFGKPSPVTEVRCFPYEIIRKEITIVGNAGNAFHFSKAIDVAKAMGRRYLDFDKLGVKTFELENYKEAFQQKKLNEVSKIVFKIES